MRIFLRLRFNLRVRFFFHLAVRVERRRRRDIFVGQFCFARKGHNNTLFIITFRESSKTTTKNRSKKRESRHRAPPERAAETSAKKNANRLSPHPSFLPARISRVVSPRARSRRPLSLLFPRARVSEFFVPRNDAISSRVRKRTHRRRRKTQPPPPTRRLPVGKKKRIVFVVYVVVVVKVVSRTSHFPCALF